MNIANEIYHLAYSAGAARSVALGAGSDLSAPIIGVATAFVTAFPHLAREEAVDADVEIDEATLEHMKQLLISLPGDVEFGGDFSFVYDMRRKTEVLQAANEYLDGLELFPAAALSSVRESAGVTPTLSSSRMSWHPSCASRSAGWPPRALAIFS